MDSPLEDFEPVDTEALIAAAIGVAIGVSVQAWDADLDALAALGSPGLIAKTAANTVSLRSITVGSNLSISNGDGQAGNPLISLANQNANVFLGGPTSGGAAAPTFRTITLASADFANQGTGNTLLHGNAAGNPTFAVVTPSDAAGNTSGTGNFALVDSPVFTTHISTPKIVSASGELVATPTVGFTGGFDGMGNTYSDRGISGGAVEIGYDATNGIGNIAAINEGVAWKAMNYQANTHNFYVTGGTSPSLQIPASGVPVIVNTGLTVLGGPIVGSDIMVTRFAASPGARLLSVYDNLTLGSSASCLTVLQRNSVEKWSYGNDIGNTGAQDFFWYDSVAAKTRFFIDSSGNLILNGATSSTTIGNANKFQIPGTTAATNSLGISAWSADALGSRIELGKSRGAAIGTNTIVVSGDVLGSVTGYGANGSTFTNAAQISIEVDGTPGATNDMPGRVVIKTTPDGSGTLTEAARFDCNQNTVLIGSIKTGTPTTGTAAAWKLGSLVGGQIGLVLLATQYIEVDVAGTLYRLATV